LLNSEKLMLAGFDYYLENYPTGNLAPLLLYNAGDLLYSHNAFPESRFYLRRLILDFPNNKLVEESYKLMINGYFQSKDYAGVEEVAARIAKAPNISPELKRIAYNRKAEAVFISASTLKKGDSHLDAAREFKRVALETPDNELAEGALFQAGLEFMAAKAWNDAIEVFLMVVERYPKSQYCDKSLYNAAYIQNNELNNPASSAQTFERMVKNYPQSDFCQDALSQASANYLKVQDYSSAIRVNEMYVSRFPQADDANLYLFENAGHYLKLNQVDQANDIYRRFAEKFPDDPRTVQAHFERASYTLGKNNRPEAAQEFRSTVDAHEKLVGKGLPGYPKYAAQALSHLLIWEHEEYNQLALRLPVNDLNQAKERKKNWRNSLFEKYQQLLRLGTKEGYQAFYKIGLLDEELAEATYHQEMPEIKDVNKRIPAITEICDQSILLIRVAVESFKTGITSLTDIEAQLQTEKNRMQGEFDSLNELVTQIQKDTSAVGVSDHVRKLSNLRRGLAEIDSAITEAQIWRAACNDKLPEVALHNGDYLSKLWRENLDFRSQEKDEEIRMLVREEVLGNGVAPLTAELAGLYLSAWESIASFQPEARWQGDYEARLKGVLDTLQTAYLEQCSIAKGRLERNVAQIEELLPKGEDAKNKQRQTVYDLNSIVLDQVDYWNKFSLDYLAAFALVLDTIDQHSGLPKGFGQAGRATGLQFALDQFNRFNEYRTFAEEKRERCVEQYSEKNEIQYDDASVAYEDIAANLADYQIAILEAGLKLKETHLISGPEGLEIVRLLVQLKPTEYASRFRIQSEKHAIVSSTDWLVWPRQETGFETLNLDDQAWRPATRGGFPSGMTFGLLDSMGAKPIWFNLEKPAEGTGEAIDSLTQTDTLGADSVWRVWMDPDPNGIRRYWFRKSFHTVTKPSGGRVYVTADDNFSLYLNGFYIFEDPQDSIDWSQVEEFDVGPYLTKGTNILAIVASDVDNTRRGLIAGLIYEIIPDLQRQLDALSRQEAKPVEAPPPVASTEPKPVTTPRGPTPTIEEVAPPPEKPAEEHAISEEVKAYEHRAILKNKLR
ncbi:MAG: tetratricopeptide repeat protein, partial [Calditrichota bacterium]